MMGRSSKRYSDKALTLAYEPLNVGELDAPDGLGYINGSCGDSMWIYLETDDRIISNAAFIADGCGATLACGSAVTELIKGLSIESAGKLTSHDIIIFLDGLPDSQHHCAEFTIDVLKKALQEIMIDSAVQNNRIIPLEPKQLTE